MLEMHWQSPGHPLQSVSGCQARRKRNKANSPKVIMKIAANVPQALNSVHLLHDLQGWVWLYHASPGRMHKQQGQ